MNGASSASTPLSPSGDAKDKERVGVLLDINNELLLETMHIQNTQQLIKKERAAADGASGPNETEHKTTEDEELLSQDYIQYVIHTEASQPHN